MPGVRSLLDHLTLNGVGRFGLARPIDRRITRPSCRRGAAASHLSDMELQLVNVGPTGPTPTFEIRQLLFLQTEPKTTRSILNVRFAFED